MIIPNQVGPFLPKTGSTWVHKENGTRIELGSVFLGQVSFVFLPDRSADDMKVSQLLAYWREVIS